MQLVSLPSPSTSIEKMSHSCAPSVWVTDVLQNRPEHKHTSSPATFNFPDAHNLLRHALHLAETLEVASTTLNSWIEAFVKSERRIGKKATPRLEDDDDLPASSYYDSLIQSLQLLGNLKSRSASNEARLRNEISLAFNMVSQADTRAMRVISLVTLLFLPATFVSTLFSMSFFSYQPADGPQNKWGVTGRIWIYFAVAGPLTILTVLLWFFGEKWIEAIKRKWKKRKDWRNNIVFVAFGHPSDRAASYMPIKDTSFWWCPYLAS